MAKVKGMNFQKWCRMDENDERKINYTLKGFWDGSEHEEKFTSEDEVDSSTMLRIVNSTIENLNLVGDEWFVVLNC